MSDKKLIVDLSLVLFLCALLAVVVYIFVDKWTGQLEISEVFDSCDPVCNTTLFNVTYIGVRISEDIIKCYCRTPDGFHSTSFIYYLENDSFSPQVLGLE